MSFEKNVYDFIKALKKFNYTLDFTTLIWQFVLITKDNQYHQLRMVKDNNIFYLTDIDGHRSTLEIELNKSVKTAYDVLYYDDLGRYKTRIKPFIIWEPLPILTPSVS